MKGLLIRSGGLFNDLLIHTCMYMGMKRIDLYFDSAILNKLKEIKKKEGVPVSEIIRRAVALYIEKVEREKDSH